MRVLECEHPHYWELTVYHRKKKGGKVVEEPTRKVCIHPEHGPWPEEKVKTP